MSREKYSRKSKIFLVYYYVLITFIIIQHLPIIFDNYYSTIRLVLYVMLIIGIVYFIFHYKIPRNKLWIYMGLLFLYTLMIGVVNLFSKNGMFSIFEIAIPFGIMIISNNYFFKENEKNTFIKYFIFIATILAVSIVLFYNNGFSISEIYNIPSKNQVGPIIATALLLSICMLFRKSMIDILLFLCTILLFVSLLVIRNRSGIVGVMIVFAFFVVKNTKKLKKSTIVFSSIVLLGLVFLILSPIGGNIFEYVYASLFSNYNVHDIDSISAGRINTYKEGLDYIRENIFFGSITSVQPYANTILPHNYVINKLVQLGYIGASPFILFYLYLWFFFFKYSHNKNYSPWILGLGLIVSLFEYTYPFGPGVSQFMLWFLLGQEFSQNKIRSEENN